MHVSLGKNKEGSEPSEPLSRTFGNEVAAAASMRFATSHHHPSRYFDKISAEKIVLRRTTTSYWEPRPPELLELLTWCVVRKSE